MRSADQITPYLFILLAISLGLPRLADAQQTKQPLPGKSILEYLPSQQDLANGTQPAPSKSTPQPDRNTRPQPNLRPAVPKKTPTTTAPVDASSDLNRLLTQLVLDSIPHTFTEDKDWGGQAERWDGLKIKREGLKIKTKRRKKKVNHGTWKKYSASLRNAKREFSISILNMRELPEERVAFDLHCATHLDIEGRQSKWLKGVQLYSLSARGHAKVRLTVSIELQVKTDTKVFPPDLLFVPVAKKANLTVVEFRIDRVGKIGGDVAQQVTKAVRKKLDEKLADYQADLVKKINRQLTKKKDRLRLSVADAIKSKWTKVGKAFLPKDVREAMDTESK